MLQLDALLKISLDLTSSETSPEQRFRRLLDAICAAIPCDAAALLRLQDDDLVPVATRGLRADVMGRRFRRSEHPRLDAIYQATSVVQFLPDSPLPDPFDGLLDVDPHALRDVHACLGCRLQSEGRSVGVLTVDALAPHAFDKLEEKFLNALGALAGASMQTTMLIEALQRKAARQGLIAQDLMRDQRIRQGGELLGTSSVMQQLREDIELLAGTDMTVLIMGETGVGKELVARAIHEASRRRDEPLTYLNCAALPESLVESELFGHVRGAFTGATVDRHGKFEVADGGTLFLDEIGELPLPSQPKILRALQEGEIQRVGSDHSVHVNVRVLAATNRSLEREVAAGRFRADLFHRLNVYPVRVPALRDRANDIPILTGYFGDAIRRRLGLGPVRFTADALRAMRSYPWPGNVRELENVVSRTVLKASAKIALGGAVIVGLELVGADLKGDSERGPASVPVLSDTEPLPLREAVERYQRKLVMAAVEQSGGNWASAARALGINRGNLHHLAERLGLREPTGK